MTKTKNKKRIKNSIFLIIDLVKKEHITPQEFRYICARVRLKCGLQVPKVPQRLPDFLNPAEIYKLLDVSKDFSFDNLLIEFLIFTGLRIGEARNLLIGHIDFYNNQLKVVNGKGGKDRNVPISQNLLSKIKLFIGKRQRGFVFCRSDERPYSIRGLRYKIKKHIKACNFTKYIYVHSLRHTFACLCLSKGLRLEDIKLIMGHSHIKTTEIYAKLELGSVKEQFITLMQGGA